jgi:uncharacterized membrane protein YkoI
VNIFRLSLLGALCLGCSSLALADDDIPVKDVPEKAVAAVKAKVGDSTMLSAERETKGGRVVYEVKVRLADGKKKEVKVTAEGEILKVEDED